MKTVKDAVDHYGGFWPEGHNYICLDVSSGVLAPFYSKPVAYPWKLVCTRAEFEAEVGRRKNRERYGTDYNPDDVAFKSVEWDGEGLPPVGCECEMEGDPGKWFSVIPVAYGFGSRVCVFAESNDGVLDALAIFNTEREKFRPLKTKAEKEREAVIADMMSYYDSIDPLKLCAALYEAGYRKEEKTND